MNKNLINYLGLLLMAVACLSEWIREQERNVLLLFIEERLHNLET